MRMSYTYDDQSGTRHDRAPRQRNRAEMSRLSDRREVLGIWYPAANDNRSRKEIRPRCIPGARNTRSGTLTLPTRTQEGADMAQGTRTVSGTHRSVGHSRVTAPRDQATRATAEPSTR